MTSSLKRGWVLKPLIEVATLQRGYDLPVQSRRLGDVPIFAANGPVGYHNEAKVTGPGVITGRSGSIGKVHYVESDYWPLNTALYVKSFHGNDPKFVYYLLSVLGLEKYSEGTGVPTLNRNNIHGVHVPLPPLPEQKRIAAILDKADSIRRKRQEAVRLTEDLQRSVFLNMFGDPVTNPKGWKHARLEDVADIVSGVTKGRKLEGKQTVVVPYLRVANVQDGYLDLGEIKEIEVLPSDVEKYRLLNGDILLTEGGDPDKLGRGTVWRANIDECIHQNHIFRVRIKSGNLLPDFLSTLIGSERGKRYFLRAAKQTTGIASINSTQLKNFPVLIPSFELQQQFAQCIVSTQSLNNRLSETEATTGTLFISLLHRAFKGEL